MIIQSVLMFSSVISDRFLGDRDNLKHSFRVKNELLLDLDYDEDSNAQCDVNIVMNEQLELIEVQGTGEESAFSKEQFKDLVDLAENGLKDLFVLQNEIIKNG